MNKHYYRFSELERQEGMRAYKRLKRASLDVPRDTLDAYTEYCRWQRNLRDAGVPRRYQNLPLKDDGIIDLLAVDIAVRGTRVVDLTVKERLLVVERLTSMGHGADTIAKHLGIHHKACQEYMKKIGRGMCDAIRSDESVSWADAA